MFRATLGFCVGSHSSLKGLFPFFPNVRLDDFGSQTMAWLSFHSAVSIVTKRQSGWLLLLWAEIRPTLKAYMAFWLKEQRKDSLGAECLWFPLREVSTTECF